VVTPAHSSGVAAAGPDRPDLCSLPARQLAQARQKFPKQPTPTPSPTLVAGDVVADPADDADDLVARAVWGFCGGLLTLVSADAYARKVKASSGSILVGDGDGDGEESASGQPKRGARGPLPKSGRTRAALLAAARTAFEERGFVDTRLVDITTSAGVAQGTFYNYFSSKEEIFESVVVEVMADVTRRTQRFSQGPASNYDRILEANRQFMEAYRHNAAFMRVFEQVASFDPAMSALRRQIRDDFVGRARRGIESMQRQGVARTDVDATLVAHALVAMIDNVAYTWLVLADRQDEDAIVETVSDIWAAAIGLVDDRESAGWPRGPVSRGSARQRASKPS
jgi:AcrR family transcriptional regulator